jgi:phosphate-selective porin
MALPSLELIVALGPALPLAPTTPDAAAPAAEAPAAPSRDETQPPAARGTQLSSSVSITGNFLTDERSTKAPYG